MSFPFVNDPAFYAHNENALYRINSSYPGNASGGVHCYPHFAQLNKGKLEI